MSGGPLFVTRFPTPRAFLEGAGAFLEANEVENNLILGISRDLSLDSSGLIRDPYFAAVCRGDEVRMVVLVQYLEDQGLVWAVEEPGDLAVEIVGDAIDAQA